MKGQSIKLSSFFSDNSVKHYIGPAQAAETALFHSANGAP
jgi:hypothetical protein